MTRPGTASFETHLAQVAGEVEQRLDSILSCKSADPTSQHDWPDRLRAAMRHAVLGGGKRLRPFLVIETARLLGRADHGPLIAGCALELVHCYSLVHDDLPAMDDDDLRRGRPTVHKAFDEATAILAGDALLTLAFEVMAGEEVDAGTGTRLALTAALARAAGAAGMVGGQMLDLAAESLVAQGLPPYAEAEIRRLQAMKTGALLAFAVEAGALLGRADAQAHRRLIAYGQALGAAFQIGDDILDVEATAEALGKATGKDAAKGKATLVAALGIARAKAERDRLAGLAIEALSAYGAEAELLRDAARFTVERRS
ncbi:farnesyl diphosphate synthase [Rhizobiales bacterium GAS191]|jgi:farnesyl diphosphate synthase|nr:farnesyl diphosphate synthase [Rhizobiales bacterium GAS191]